MYKLVMLDLDGTLVDSIAGIATSFNATLAASGYPTQPDTLIVPMIGLPLATMFERFIPQEEHAAITSLITTYRMIYAEQAIPRAQLFPEVAETLWQLHNAGRLLTIASSKTRPVLQQVLAVCGIENLFALIMGNDCVQQLKPHPEMLFTTLAHFDCTTDEALMVGDSVHDIAMGKAAGVRTCAVTYGASSRAELRLLEPEYTIERFGVLYDIISEP